MEHELIQRIKGGDQKAFKQLYEQYADYAIRIATAVTRNQANAKDVVQETFIRVYRNIHSFDNHQSFQPWLYRILLNECNRFLKKNSQTIPIDINEELNLPPEVDHYEFEEYEELYEAIGELEDIHRVPLVLKYLSDFKEREIAQILELNLNTVKSRLFKGRQKLKELLLKVREG
ncbi:RNA polymerase sigma factor [Bacillus salitolerans]|uniref:RNA polymerase sigma factor n=1 Tax=Bacillus salitolerans TaxID=1437434 RepID=A0ABW4LTR5_9BACI